MTTAILNLAHYRSHSFTRTGPKLEEEKLYWKDIVQAACPFIVLPTQEVRYAFAIKGFTSS